MKFSNPRLRAEFDDWPLGGNKRGKCVFQIEHDQKRGWRVTRTTTGKPKVRTYGGQAAIVDCDNGRTYILQFARIYDFITIIRSDFFDEAGVFPESQPELHKELSALILQGGALVNAITNA
jgi:hypothetical protein